MFISFYDIIIRQSNKVIGYCKPEIFDIQNATHIVGGNVMCNDTDKQNVIGFNVTDIESYKVCKYGIYITYKYCWITVFYQFQVK